MPVFPEVGSMMTVSGSIRPSASAASIMARAMRSFTQLRGLNDSSLTTTSAAAPRVKRRMRTSGVDPMVLVMSSWMGMAFPLWVPF
jgi:hypothetical protein